MALEVKIEKKIGKFRLKAEFTVAIETLGIMGISGSGKSMTLKCIAGIETPDSGRIVLNGRVLYDSERRINLPPQKRKVGYLFQEYALFPNMTVRQNIMAGIGRKKSPELADAYLKRFHLEGLDGQYPAQLSGGQKQRTALARMLAAQPEVILLDEPFSALDSHLRKRMIQEMTEHLCEAACPVVLVTHNREEVYRLCSRAVCLQEGQLEEVQSVKDFFRHPRTRTAALLSGCENVTDVQWIDAEHLYVPQWGITLCGTGIPKNVCAVGIRAHSFVTEESACGNGKNRFVVGEGYVTEEPFEWVMRFRRDASCDYLEWRVSRQLRGDVFGKMPDYLIVQEENLLFLQR